MKSLIKNVLVCGSLVAALTACSSENKDTVTITAKQQMDSAELANAGEQLMMPHSLQLAYRVFDMALTKDPANKKAQFYKNFLERFMIFEGVLTRIQPYVDKYGNAEGYNQMMKDLPNHPMRDFLVNMKPGAKKISTAADIQDLLVEYRLAAEKFRNFIIANQDINMDLYLNPYLFANQIEENKKDYCTATEESSDSGLTIVCNKQDIALVKVNVADMMVLKQFAAGEIAYVALATSYSVGSIEQLGSFDSKEKKTTKEIFDDLESVKDLGHLMKNQGLTSLRKLGSDFVVGMKWAIQFQNNLCKRDQTGKNVARKAFLVKDLCIDDVNEAQKAVRVFESILAGTIKVQADIGNDEKVDLNVNYLAPFDRPTDNLRTLLPKSWTASGEKATSFRDKTLGGALPDGNADLLLKNNK